MGQGIPGRIHRTTHASSKICMIIGSVRVGSGIGVSDGCEASDAIGSRCSVCSFSAIARVVDYAWSVGSGASSGQTSSSMVGIGAGSDSTSRGTASCGDSSVVGVSFEAGSSAGVVACGASWAVGIESWAVGGLESLSGSSTFSMSSYPNSLRSTSYS